MSIQRLPGMTPPAVTAQLQPALREVPLATDDGRQTPRQQSFGQVLARGVETALMAGANLLRPSIPAGLALAASVSGAAAGVGGAAGATAGAAGGATSAAGAAGAPSPEQQLLSDQEAARGRDRVFNLQYLDLQRKTQEDQRQFQVATNLLKAQHETVKTAINNLR